MNVLFIVYLKKVCYYIFFFYSFLFFSLYVFCCFFIIVFGIIGSFRCRTLVPSFIYHLFSTRSSFVCALSVFFCLYAYHIATIVMKEKKNSVYFFFFQLEFVRLLSLVVWIYCLFCLLTNEPKLEIMSRFCECSITVNVSIVIKNYSKYD